MCARYWKYNRKSQARFKRQSRPHKTAKHRPKGKEGATQSPKIKQKIAQGMSGSAVAGWRLWLFRIIALTVIPPLLFLLLELGLRIIGYGFSPSAIIECEVNGKACYCNNAKFAWQFFPPTIARESSPFAFPADKSNSTYRIFVLGASAAAGTPDGAFCFGRILQVMLRQQYPQANFEVITIAMPAINSHVVLEIAKDCAHHQADLFILYLGNNEVVGPYGAGTVFTPLSSNLPRDERLVNLSLLPTCGTKFFQYAGDWKKIYSEDFTADEKEKIVSSLKKALGEAGFKVEKSGERSSKTGEAR